MFIAFFISLAISQCTVQLCDYASGIAQMKTEKISKVDALNILNKVDEYLGAYAFRDIAKNPPQPSGHDGYFPPYDMDAGIAEIQTYLDSQTDSVSFHDFYVKLIRLMGGPRDLHLSISMDSNVKHLVADYFVVNPIQFSLKGTKVYFSVPSTILGVDPEIIFGGSLISDLRAKAYNGDEVITINDINATQFIRDYAYKYFLLKNENGAVTYFQSAFVLHAYSDVPIDTADTTFKLSFSDNTEVSFNSYFFNEGGKNAKSPFTTAIETIKKFKKGVEERKKKDASRFEFKTLEPITNKLFQPKLKGANLYTHSLTDVISCGKRNVSGKDMNILTVNSFSPDNYTDFFTYAKLCGELFDTNTDPIVVFLPLNGGGYVDAEVYLYNLLSPNTDYNKRSVARINSSTEKVLRNGFGFDLIDPTTGTPYWTESDSTHVGAMGSWYDTPQTEMYGSVNFTHTIPSYLDSTNERYETKNIRKPNEIVVFSDHYCFSACSLLTKHLVDKKAAILVTYAGLPYSKYRTVGESPTAVIEDKQIHNGQETVLSSKGLTMGISFFPTLPLNKDDMIPNEYKVHEPDEYVPLETFSEDETTVDAFLEQAILIMKKHSENCEEGSVVKESKCTQNSVSEIWGTKCVNGIYSLDNCVFVECNSGYKSDGQTCVKNDTSECKSGEVSVDKLCSETTESELWGATCVNGKFDTTKCQFVKCQSGFTQTTENKCVKDEKCVDGTILQSDKCKNMKEGEIWSATCVDGVFDYEHCEFVGCKDGYKKEDTGFCVKDHNENVDSDTSHLSFIVVFSVLMIFLI
ncbi:hypothetical protein EIN_467740 [Entamoeba invadens IP1]|uniref:EGF-like domain-containing protein n=1 Tax=Entamoeba invadens IP1 TaxID=370355 RepID=A0A0A1TUG7_ENTIV|nr:hypothetical protein EIN_467740 [Entamoeba invadens IP1]ELP83670.1 hypothetical protein EIN_467740 [Entamoeba invadens IP1]|eukprot:XP_004183016.1 hypothetical protein EIN_467740 [Entamoeba invadens IP1]